MKIYAELIRNYKNLEIKSSKDNNYQSHCGNQDYIKGFETEESATLNIFVDPAYIGAISLNDVKGVMRVLRNFPHSIKDRETDNKSLYHSSTYAAKLDSDWEEDKKAIIEKFNKKVEEINSEIAELNAL